MLASRNTPAPEIEAAAAELRAAGLAAEALALDVTDLAAFEAAVLTCPRSSKLHQQICTVRTGQRRLDEATTHCDTSRALDSTFCDVEKSAGFLAIAKDDVHGAIAAFNASHLSMN